MPCKQLGCESVTELLSLIEKECKDASNIFVLCTGSEDPTTGKSWCPDCVKAEPVIENCLKSSKDTDVFIVAIAGDRPIWKNPDNEFRKHPKTLLKSIPTLIKWGTPERLSEGQCSDANLVSMMLEED
ncbi:thioredoxin domain-containing protein 17-like [Clytia hemisphaerica]|uniref:Thioredoxin domain-containing protein 17 n=1 Tax=Clytia hemisphaerica TaxID=252671 RepID=A0A7M5UW53_9CNID